ncbi:MAG TPA: SdiA-regulated domain-containing protein [Chitinispirillaceae bacterium]|nr:SdiA-regulated domain-containing protein [Chitinispirillaceae bacterium]
MGSIYYQGAHLFKIELPKQQPLSLCVDGEDMEGICQNFENKLLYVLEERRREIVIFDTLGTEKGRFKVDVEKTNENDGLEGIAINPSENQVFVVNKRFRSVLIELEITGKNSLRQTSQYIPVYFGADEDSSDWSLAGLSYDIDENVLWMTSDRTRAVFVIDHTGRALAVYDVFEEDLEAVAVIKQENRIYFVSDDYHTLYVYEYPEPFPRLNAEK